MTIDDFVQQTFFPKSDIARFEFANGADVHVRDLGSKRVEVALAYDPTDFDRDSYFMGPEALREAATLFVRIATALENR